MKLFDMLLLPENLIWAWRKVKRSYLRSDVIYDHLELAEFELLLEEKLADIASDFENRTYALESLKILPHPKKPDKEGNPRLRQYFEISVRDQVAWMAIANTIGPLLDLRMPAWSYGNRLYRAAWYDDLEEGGKSPLNLGPYRHSSGNCYRHFKHSWPLFRRHISLTARKMTSGELNIDELDHGELDALRQAGELRYLDSEHWPVRLPTASDTIYAASLDLKKFYPSIRTKAILDALDEYLPGFKEESAFREIVQKMLSFSVNVTEVDAQVLLTVDPPVADGHFDGLPTGLHVAGFLANVAMLRIDDQVERTLDLKRDIAHFRFVDDHEILAYDFNTLSEWIKEYSLLLGDSGIGPEIEEDKYVPEDLKFVLSGKGAAEEAPADTKKRVQSECEVNGRKPTSLMTRTLAQVSMLAAADFDLISDSGRAQRLEQLEWLLLANIPEHEIRLDTRVAFAASRISALTPSLYRQSEALLLATRELSSLKEGDPKLVELRGRVQELQREDSSKWDALLSKHFSLLMEAFVNHPDKVRLFLRLFDYCRLTGYAGLGRVAEWMKEHSLSSDRLQQLKNYLGALALNVLAKHILSAADAISDGCLLHREIDAANSFLNHVSTFPSENFVEHTSTELNFYQKNSLRTFSAALLLASLTLKSRKAESLNLLASILANRAQHLVKGLSIESLAKSSGIPIGVWMHWRLSIGSEKILNDWSYIASLHQVEDKRDWTSLRRFPTEMTSEIWSSFVRFSSRLKADDAGWVMDVRQKRPELLIDFPEGPLNQVFNFELNDHPTNTLLGWAQFLQTLKAHDPRRSEWTALEISRQVLEKLLAFETERDDVIQALHPANILIPNEWIAINEIHLVGDKLTWEKWREIVKSSPLTICSQRVSDYRYSGTVVESDWIKSRRALGQILWGLLKGNFDLPFDWNIRGLERSLLGKVVRECEKLPISSCTLSLLLACLMPRNKETSIMNVYPNLFGDIGKTADDTKFDLLIDSWQDLDDFIKQAQEILSTSQMSVFNHAARQLIPVRLKQMSQLADLQPNNAGANEE